MATILGGTSFAQCPADDAVTTNNDCASAAAGTVGSVTGLSVQFDVEDYWTYSVPAGQELTVDCLFLHSTADLDLRLFDDGVCGTPTTSSGSTTDNEQVTYLNTTAAPVSVVLLVNIFQNSGTCNDYDLIATLAQGPCVGLIEDGEEQNDTCLTAVNPSANLLTGLTVSTSDEDFYSYTLNPGEILDLRLDYINSNGDVDAQLLDSSDCATVLANANFSFSNFEELTYTNNTGAAQTVILRVLIDVTTSINIPCNSYDLSSAITVDPCSLLIGDSEEENDDCFSAVTPSANPLPMLNVSKSDEDWYSYTVNDGEQLTVTALHTSANGDIDLEVVDTSNCLTVLAASTTISDEETVMWSNLTGATQTVAVRAFIWAGDDLDCNPDYTLSSILSGDPCTTAIDDPLEENDTCQTAGAGPMTASGLFVSLVDEDFYAYTLQPDEILEIDVLYLNGDGDIDVQLIDAADCTTILEFSDGSFTDNETVLYNNTTGAAQTLVLRVNIDLTSTSNCNTYDIAATISIDPCVAAVDDMFEENDDCLNAAPVPTGLQAGLFVEKEGVDEDWFSIDVLPGQTLTVTATFVNDDGDIDIDLFDACGGVLLEGSAGVTNIEDVTWTNTTGATVNAKWGVFVWAGDPTESCNTYDMNVELQGRQVFTAFCFGDGSGTPCPCSNNSSAGHPGGCANSAGNGAVLTATGNPIVGADTLSFSLSSAAPTTMALLVSALNPLPQVGGCVGCGDPAFDGLRCAGGDFRRHGTRLTDASGNTPTTWGGLGGPAGGLIARSGLAAGQTRYFFAFYRDDVTQVCGGAQNSSNGIEVTFN